MRTRLGLVLGVVASLLLGTQAFALDVCDELGLSGLTISSDTNCLQISGKVEYEFLWGDNKPADCDSHRTQCRDDGPSYAVGDMLAFSKLRIGVDPGFILTAPDPLPLLETGSPATAPAYTLPVTYTGFTIGANFGAQVDVKGWLPLDLGLDVEYGQINGKGTSGSQAFGSLGVQSVGLINGAFQGSTTVNSTDFQSSRSFLNFDKQLHVPFVTGRMEMWGYPETFTAYVIGGTRGGMINETQQTRIGTSRGTVNYDAALNGGFFGGYLGLGVDKAMFMPDRDMTINAHAGLIAGLDMHRYRVTDTVSGTFTGLTGSTNTYDVTDWVPTMKLFGGVDLVTQNKMTIGLNGGVSAGYYPALDLIRPISNQPATPTLDARSTLNAELSARITFRF